MSGTPWELGRPDRFVLAHSGASQMGVYDGVTDRGGQSDADDATAWR